MNHTPQQIGKHRVNLSCFAPERKHQFNKQALDFIFRNMEVALVSRNADAMLRLAQQKSSFEPFRMCGNLREVKDTDPGMDLLQGLVGEAAARRAQRSIDARSPAGALHRGDMCSWLAGGALQLGFVIFFYEVVTGAEARPVRVVLANICSSCGGAWQKTDERVLFSLDVVAGPLTYFEGEDGKLTPHLPTMS